MPILYYISSPRHLFALCLAFLSINDSYGQKTYFEEVDVEEFVPPFDELIISVYGTEQPVKITTKTKFRGQKNKKLAPGQLEEGTLITKLAYDLVGEDYVATTIDTEISADGSIRIYGLYEGMHDGMAIIDGYPVKLLAGATLEGERNMLKKKACDCAGLEIPKFEHPLLPVGLFYVDVRGFKDEAGVITAHKVTLCRNTFAKPERELLAAVNENLMDNTTKIVQVPAGVFSPPMGLYNGQVEVGQYSYPLTNNIELQGYINQVGNRLIPDHAQKVQIDGGKISYRFYVIDDPVPNAFAFPNGMIFCHTGLLDVIENEAQLAAVLGHEIAHVTHEHGRERYANSSLVKSGMTVFNTFFDKSLKNQFTRLAPGLSPSMLNSLSTVSAGITPAAVSNVIKPQTKMEAQADRVGLFYAYEAGYDIREAAKFWQKMQDLTASSSFQSEVTQQLISSLESNRFNYSSYGQNPLQQLGAAGVDVLAKQILNTIYTSHPKAKKRARAINQLVSTVYAETDWQQLRVKEEKYKEILGQ